MIHHFDLCVNVRGLTHLPGPRPWTFLLLAFSLATVFCSGSLSAVQQAGGEVEAERAQKKPLDHESYNQWNNIGARTISNDGRWVMYVLKPGDPEANSTLKIQSLRSEKGFDAVRGFDAKFTNDSRYVVYLIKPDSEAVKKAKKEEKKPEDQPKNGLGILDLTGGTRVTVERAKSFALPEEGSGRLAYLLEAKPKEDEKAAEEQPAKKKRKSQQEKTSEEPEAKVKSEEKKEDAREGDKDKKKTGTDLVLRDLARGAEQRFENVLEYRFNRAGSMLVYTVSAKDAKQNGVHIVRTKRGKKRVLARGEGDYKNPVFDKRGRQLAFLSNRDHAEQKPKPWAVYHWRRSMKQAVAVAGKGSDGISEGWWVSEHRDPSFSENGQRLFLGTAPRPDPNEHEGDDQKNGEGKDADPNDEAEKVVKVDIWHWKDPLLQPHQLKQLDKERKRSYLAVVHLDSGKLVQLATEDIPEISVGAKGDANIALGTSRLPYRMLVSWDSPGYQDVYLVNVRSGKSERILERLQGNAQLSPEAEFVTWWDRRNLAWFALNVETRKTVNLTELLPHPVHNELHDTPSLPRAYGNAGWTNDDKAFLIYDRHDVWAANPQGFWPPICVTDGAGRKKDLRLRYVRLDPEEDAVDANKPMLLSSFHLTTKASGFYRDRVRGTKPPQLLTQLDERFSTPRKAKDGDVLLFTRSSFQRFGDLWVADLKFSEMKQVSRANPQQDEYLWGSAELIEWTSLDGTSLQGILYKPENFDESRKYPMLVYFYERSSDSLHSHMIPAPSSSSINRTFYVSRGYVVFVPDIPYRIGYPGQSAVNAILPGVSHLIDKGFVDKDHIGVQGHSWGGYQVAYMVTKTRVFAAAEAGAPVSNMTSAYGGIRWSTGLSRMHQYEKTQSRIGGTLWDSTQKYLENSPLFRADQIYTPLLILHNDQDGAVPWYQGIELFVAMRRLGRPCWLFNYNGEAHSVRQDHNKRDWTVRLQQFFDHYLKDAPAPVWLAEGVPAIKKGKDFGLDLKASGATESKKSKGKRTAD